MPNIYDEFLRWLKNTDTDRFFAAKMGRDIMYIKIKCNDKIDMIYCLCYTDGEEMVAKENLEYQAVYCKPEEKLYDVQYNLYDMLRKYGSIELGYETERCEFEERVRERIEEIVAGYSDRIVLDNDAREKLERYKYSIDQAARKLYFNEADADVLYKCGYCTDDFGKYLVKYITNREETIKRVAEEYHKLKRDNIKESILENRLIKEKVEEYKNGIDKKAECVKKIINSIPSECKTVNVTTVIDGKELTFKTEASVLRLDCTNDYPTWYIRASDREIYERMYNKYQGYKPEEITKITFGRKILYEREVN